MPLANRRKKAAFVALVRRKTQRALPSTHPLLRLEDLQSWKPIASADRTVKTPSHQSAFATARVRRAGKINGARRHRRRHDPGLAQIHGPAATATAETATPSEPPVSETARRLLEAPLRVRTTIIITEHAPRLDAVARERAGRPEVGPHPAAPSTTGAEPVAAAVDAF